MAAAALGSMPLGRVSDVWGRRPLMLGGMAVGAATSLLLPLVEGTLPLLAIYGLAGLGVAAFTPSALSLIGDAAPPGRTGSAYAWYSMAHYGAIGVGPFLGGLVATTVDRLSRFLEVRAPLASRRLATLAALQARGIDTYAFVHRRILDAIVAELVHEHGLTLRLGRVLRHDPD